MVAVGALLVGGCGSSGDKAASTDGTGKPADSGKNDDGGKKDDGDGSPTGPKDTCALLSIEDASAAVGGVEMERSEDSSDEACSYNGVDPLDMAVVTVSYDPSGLKGTSLKEVAKATAGMASGEDAEAVDGVGDEAYLVNIMGVDTLLVAKGDGSLLVNIMGGEKEDHRDALSDLAKKALDKL
jgi:hypothetical protein